MSKQANQQKNWFEWTVFGVGCVLVALILASLVHEMLSASPLRSPKIEVDLGEAEQRGGRYEIPVKVHNRGEESAEGVEIEVVLKLQNGQEEKASFEVQFMPKGSQRQGYVIFHNDPALAASIEARPTGYEKP